MAPDPLTQMNTYRSYVTMLADPVSKDELKLKAAQELSENFEIIMCSLQYPQFLDHMMKIFLKILQEGEPHFISEYNIQQVRKLILEMIHRLPSNEYLRPYVRQILTLIFKLLETDNEENVLVCLRIIIDLHKQYKPTFNPEIQYFLQFVKSVYSELPKNLSKIFEPRPPLRVKDLSEINIEALLKETFTITAIQSEKKAADGTVVTYNLIPKAVLSLKVLQELPIIVVLLNQLYKQNVYQDVSDFVPIVITTISLQPSLQHRSSPGFNKEVFVDFMGAQVKTLSFLAYVIRPYQDLISQNSTMLVKGILGLFTLCPMEVAHLRKELVIASRHILATDLRNHFIPHMEIFFNEDIFIGHGWTAHEALRPLAYSTLADLVHHVRLQLPLNDVSKAVHLYGKNLLDQTLPTAVQMVSCKLLMNLVDTVRQRSDAENSTQGRELLIRILLVFVLKFKTIAKIYIPILRNKAKQLRPAVTETTTEDTKSCIEVNEEKEQPKSKFGFPTSQAMSYNVVDYRNLVKSLVHGAKAITTNCIKSRSGEATQSNQLQPKETLIYIQLVKWALPALDIYTIGPPAIGVPAQPGRPMQSQTIRTREEKEVLDLFGNVFTQMNPQTFQEIFSVSIDYMVERIFKNCALQIIGSSFLSNHTVSSTFATILVEYLLERMSEMGSNIERSNLYLKLFKLVFGSVSLFPTENEHMLRPHLNLIVNRAMELAMSAKEPYNYFLLLRALFRSIGGGSHDLLYQEFLPLLPNMLEGLNRLQSGLHRQHMKDLFVELCLTVPVRLSSLLPYLPMLMDPLVSALNGSYCLVSQGLRTLELCVDNLQPDFLYEHIQPIRAELMQALWRTLHNSTDQAHVAFRVLGKFGGGNRRMMIEPQKLEYNDRETNSPNVVVYFQGFSQSIELPMEKVIEATFNALKSNTTDVFYRKQCWEIIYCYLVASLKMDDAAHLWYDLFTHPSFKESEIPPQQGPHYRCLDAVARNVQQTALTSMFVAVEIKELRPAVLDTVVSVVRHYTMIAIAQQAGLFSWTDREIRKDIQGQDPLVLIDALAVIMGHDERELYKAGYLALVLILETATNILGSKERACQLPFMEYLAERMCSLCYERAWYAKLGGCIAIKFLFERMATKWVLNHLFVFLKALIFVMMDLTDEVSNGAIDMAKENLEKMLRVCVNPGIQEGNMELIEAQNKSLYEVTRELVKQVTSPHTIVREQAMASLRQLAEIQHKSVTEVMEPHKEVLADMIPPKKHLLRHQPTNAQIGLMDGNTFCTTLNPRLFTIDLNILEHKVFFQELFNLCEADDATLTKLACYKSISNLMPLRKSALRALAACHYIVACREKILGVLYKSLEKPQAELQETAFECMKTFIAGFQLEMESIHTMMRPMLLTLGDHRNLSLNCVRRLSYLTQLFPSTFSVTLCEQMLQHVKKFLENLIQSRKGTSKSGEIEQKITIIIGIYHNIPASLPKFNDQLCRFILQTEKTLLVEVSSPFREPLMKCLLRFPTDALNLFLHDSNIKDQQWSRYLEYLISHKDGKPFRDILHNSTARLVTMLLAHSQTNSNLTHMEKNEVQYRAIKIIGILIKYDEQWLSTQNQLVGALKQIWYNDDYQTLHKKVEGVEYCHWKEPKHIVKILLHYFRHQPNDIDLLFQLLRATCDRFVPDFQFLRDFLENTVAQEYTVEWKRSAFFRFVEHFPTNNMSQELKANVLQLIIIPCFAISFERGEGTKLVGGAPMPYQDNPENVVSVFISKIIDPDNPFGSADCVRISLLQFSCLLVEQASQHIHDVTNKRQGNKLRRLMTFAWPCLLGKNCVDPTTRYHGHLLLSHIIAKFAIHKRIVLQVFHSLLKAHAVDARNVVRQALEILTPAMPVRMEDGNTMLTHWTKKIIVEEGHSMQQLSHILQLVVRHYKVYYPVRHHLVQHIVNSIQRIGCTPTATIEHRRLAVELAEVIIKWELYRIKEEGETSESKANVQPSGVTKRTIIDDPSGKRMSAQTAAGNSPVPLILPRMEPGSAKPIERAHADAVLNFLLRLACQVNDVTTIHGNPGEQLSRRCVALLKMALKPDVWIAEQCDLKLAWLDKVLASVDSNQPNQPNYGNISTALEVLTFLLGVMKREQILVSFKPLQRGIGACIASSNTKIIRLVHGLLSRLMTIFPAEQASPNIAPKYEELDTLYTTIGRFIAEGLATYEKTTTATPSSLFGTLMMLKAACTNNPSYIDRLITPFMRVLHKMAKEHLHSTQTEANPVTSELLILSLDLVKNRVAVMGVDMRKSFIGSILVGLIEKTQDVKVMKAITKILEEWMKNKTTLAVNQTPSLREKSILLVKMMQYVEKRFPDDLELNRQFLELVNYVYRDETLKATELTSKLEQAFLAGLRCVQPQVRAKFFDVFDSSMKRHLVDRILYIVFSQNWENIGSHYWIKQCIELLLATVNPTTLVQMTNEDLLLPSITTIMQEGMDKENKDQTRFVCRLGRIDEEPQDVEMKIKEEVDTKETLEMDAWMSNLTDSTSATASVEEITEKPSLVQMINKQIQFMENAKKVKTEQLLLAAAQLCHMDTGLAERVWLDMFPRIWSILEESHLRVIAKEVAPFVASGVHVVQKDCHPSAIGTFLESLAHCNPPVAIAPPVMKYLGKSHNVWHRITLSLEQMGAEMAADGNGGNSKSRSESDLYRSPDETEQIEGINPYYEVMHMLSEMYSLLCEEDMWSGLWQKRPAHYKETLHAIALEQQGFFEQAQGAYEVCMTKFRQDYSSAPAPYYLNEEMLLWERHWERTVKEQNQWDTLFELGSHGNYKNPFLVLDSAWRTPNWPAMKEIVAQLEQNCPREMLWKINLYRGFITLCSSEDQHLSTVERYVELASGLCMREWRRLPRIVSHVHQPLLQAAQQIMELQEAMQIHQGLLHGRSNSLHDMKAIVKTWRNRLPVIADDLSHWSDIFTWRQHHYTFITNHYDSQQDPQTATHSLLGVHASMQAIIHFGKIARKQNLCGVCLDSLARIYNIPTSVPMVDCFQKIRQQVKCHLQMATMGGQNDLQEGLDVLESTNMGYFTKEMVAEFYALKGLLQSQLGRSDDANKSFSAAAQLHDTLVKAWSLWGDYLENIFIRDARQISIGINALVCFLHACRHQNESKSRKYIAKILWLLTYDDEKSSLMETVDKYAVGVPAIQWLPWVPQLLMYLVRHEGNVILNLLSQVGRMFPQAVYFSIRTLYLTLKIEQRERYKSGELTAGKSQDGVEDRGSTTTGNVPQQQGIPETGHTVRATAPMWRCSKIMHMQRDIHPTVLSSLEGIVDQMVWFRETWYEEVLRQLRQGLAKCYAIAFENRGAVSEATITPHTLNFVKKLVSTFGIGIENISSSQNMSSSFSSAASESLARRAQATVQDPVFQKMKGQFTSDFDFTVPGARLLHNLISKLKKWIKILEEKTKQLPKSFLIEEKCRFLSNFSLKTAEVELPGEFLIPRHSHYSVKIARFVPRVEVVQRHNTAARRLRIRGHNGRLYPYLVVNDAGLGDARREERLLQLLRMLNHYLTKQKETSRRFLHFTVPRLVAVSPQMRLVEDNPAAISLLDIYKQGCAKLGMEHDAPIARYYEKLAAVQARGVQASHQVLRDILKEVETTMVSKAMLKDWAMKTFPGATDYWTFRKMFTLQLSLTCFAEYVLHLTRLNPDMMYVHQDSGLINIAYFKFDIDDTSGELDANRPVPFRLTPNIFEFLTTIGVCGPLTASAIATARCLVQPTFQLPAILRAILRDEVIADHKRQEDAEGTSQAPTDPKGELLITMVTRAVTAIVNRLNSLANFDGIDSKVSTLVAAANSHDNLCRMDPSWHPWL
ncbi:transformation/transcription domain-associated protein [Solenopsis invicta]|uniref:transformation/transcription domain-associated protein n=1 Tax=Solenopsis invicta TaxID=13686 RepID=UPI000595E232|nr:transformation/transcription domain-associated protein [Solenopsis invicta]XP_039313487.1 transformation/transcription domain-associated protein [Solenopsis invicta]XP_039313493.1 transformation/transcription domain-associated protein [Solenopsis invicta]XP_039313495.1 transformation/transcription domain-associated protein [Solenopsis invicta]XP_039313496.1 transformation/transcription domain-associated protein [Solenopsis invicta]